MTKLIVPAAREFGWALKPISSSYFDIHKKPNGQFCVVLNHALLRGVSSEMIHWWFLNFTKLRVRLDKVAGYEGKKVPGYLLWHPIDHISADLQGALGPNETAREGCTIKIREVMQFDEHGLKYPVDNELKLYYVGPDGWAMGKSLPVFGPIMMLRIHFKDVVKDGTIIGVHYHYEVVIGVSGSGPIARALNKRITSNFGPEFFEAWHRHNVIEVGTFEDFLPTLFAQRSDLSSLSYTPEMSSDLSKQEQQGWDRDLFEMRLSEYEKSPDPHHTQRCDEPTFL